MANLTTSDGMRFLLVPAVRSVLMTWQLSRAVTEPRAQVKTAAGRAGGIL